jgi:hypothetical protein
MNVSGAGSYPESHCSEAFKRVTTAFILSVKGSSAKRSHFALQVVLATFLLDEGQLLQKSSNRDDVGLSDDMVFLFLFLFLLGFVFGSDSVFDSVLDGLPPLKPSCRLVATWC